MSSTITADPIVRSGARWFWWIAGLSLVNVVMFYSGSNTNFVIGLAMTALVTVAFAGNLPVAIGLAGFTIAFYVVVGLYAQRNKLWAFYLGLAVYVLDALIYVYLQDWMSVGFHGLAAFFIFKGVARARELGRGSVEAAAGT